MEAIHGYESTCFVNHLKCSHHLSSTLLKLNTENLPPAAEDADLHWEVSASTESRVSPTQEASVTSPFEEAAAAIPSLHGSAELPSSDLDRELLALISGSVCGVSSSDSESEHVDERADGTGAPAPLRHYMQPVRPRGQSLSTLLAKMGPGCDLGADENGLTLSAQRDTSSKDTGQIERAREAVRDALIARKLLDPQLYPKPPALPYQPPQPHPTHQSLQPHRMSVGGGGGSIIGGAAAAAAGRRSMPQLDFGTAASASGSTGGGVSGASPRLQVGSVPTSMSLPLSPSSLTAPGPGSTLAKSLRQPSYASAASAPNSPMAAAAARRRQLMLDAHASAAAGLPSSYVASSHGMGASSRSPRRSGSGGGAGGGGGGRRSRRVSGTGASISGASTISVLTAGGGARAGVSGGGSVFGGGSLIDGVGGSLSATLGRLRTSSCTISGSESLAWLGGLRTPGGTGTGAGSGGGCGSDGEAGERPFEYDFEEADDDANIADLGSLVRSERKRLSMVRSKVTSALRSQQRYQGLLANAPGTGRGAGMTLTAEELTASVIPTPAKPPEGVELKVPSDDIRFSGVRLRFLMGLLDALDRHPELCRSTSDLVTNLVLPLTADHKCRLLDLIPPQHRGQPHHYICHAWPCSAREMLHTLRREMLPRPPPRPPGPMGGAAAAAPADEAAVGGEAGPGRPVPSGGPLADGGGRKDGRWAGAGVAEAGVGAGRVPGSLAPGAHLPHLGAGGGQGTGGTGGGGGPAGHSSQAEQAMALHDVDAGGRKFLPTIGAGGGGGGGGAGGGKTSLSGGGAGHPGSRTSTNGGVGSGAAAVVVGSSGERITPPTDARAAEAAWRQMYEAYKEELNRALDQVVWIDVVCHNQHSHVKKDYGKVARTVVACGSTVLVLDPHLTALNRTWCLFEMMHCLRCKRHLKVFRAQPPPPPAATAAAAAQPASLQQHSWQQQPQPPKQQQPAGGVGANPLQRQRRYAPSQPPGRGAASGGGGAEGGHAGPGGPGGAGGPGGGGGGVLSEEQRWDRAVEMINISESKASCEADRVGILQEVLATVGTAYVNDLIRSALRLSNSERARQLALRRQQLRTTLELLQPDPAVIGTEEYESNLARCREHLASVLEQFYPDDMLRCIIPRDYVSDSARCWDMLCIFAEILDREQFREDAKVLRGMAWLIFKRHSKRYIEVLYEKELDNWLVNSLEHDRKWRRTQAKLKHDAQKKWTPT